MSDDFESYPNYNSGGLSSMPVFGGAATFSAPNTQMYVYDPNAASFGLGANGPATVTSGKQGLGLFDNLTPINVDLVFNSAVTRWGAYMASDSNNGSFTTLDFFDANGNQLGTQQIISSTNNTMVWGGWASSAGIKRIHFGNNWAPVMDDMQADAVPEPATFAVLGLGAFALLRRKRK
jgi:hypothetical protein